MKIKIDLIKIMSVLLGLFLFIVPQPAGGETESVISVSPVSFSAPLNTPVLNAALSGIGEDDGYLITSDGLWIRAVIDTEEKGEIDGIWRKKGRR